MTPEEIVALRDRLKKPETVRQLTPDMQKLVKACLNGCGPCEIKALTYWGPKILAALPKE